MTGDAQTRKSDPTLDDTEFYDDLFVEEDIIDSATAAAVEPWRVLVVDDEEDIHISTELVLADIEFAGKPVKLLNAYSAEEGRQLLQNNQNIALIFLDVVMETSSAGLDLVRFIREELDNQFIQIILRTGYPGQSPEKEVVSRYGINNYQTKTELTAVKLFTLVTTSLRTYHALTTVEAYRRDLEQEVRETQLQLIEKERLAAVGQLTAGIAHEFNNMLTIINGFSEILQIKLSPHDTRQELLSPIISSGQRATKLVHRLLAFSRKQLIRPQLLNICTVINETSATIQALLGDEIKLKVSGMPKLCMAKFDPSQLEQVLMSLAENAREAMPHGGQFTIDLSEIQINQAVVSEQTLKPGRYVLLTISDTGSGIAPEIRPHIFEPFFTTKGFGNAFGLGLSTVYGIVKQNNGEIKISDQKDTGTTFKIYWPCTPGIVD